MLQAQGKEGPRVQTDGINFEGVWAHADLVDVNRITTNDVAAMLRTYGVEVSKKQGARAHACLPGCTLAVGGPEPLPRGLGPVDACGSAWTDESTLLIYHSSKQLC